MTQPPVTLADRYRLLSRLGTGSSAEVWEAEDVLLGRRVAVKLFSAIGVDDAHLVRQRAEIHLLASLSHPHLVTVYDAVLPEAGAPGPAYLVMELVVGSTLTGLLAAGPLDAGRTAVLGAEIADALAYIHRAGVVHRDIKPANILVDAAGSAKLVDFGIALLDGATRHTAVNSALGTAAYLSPEQVQGRAIGPATDVWALGLVLLEALTGEREYPGQALESALARLHRPPLVPDWLPGAWRQLLTAMTALDPAVRPATTEVARVLRGTRQSPTDTRVMPMLTPTAATTVTPVQDSIAGGTAVMASPVADRVAYREAATRGGSGSRRVLLPVLALILLLIAGGAVALVRSGGSHQSTGAPTGVSSATPATRTAPSAAGVTSSAADASASPSAPSPTSTVGEADNNGNGKKDKPKPGRGGKDQPTVQGVIGAPNVPGNGDPGQSDGATVDPGDTSGDGSGATQTPGAGDGSSATPPGPDASTGPVGGPGPPLPPGQG